MEKYLKPGILDRRMLPEGCLSHLKSSLIVSFIIWLLLASEALCNEEYAFLLHSAKLSHVLEFLCRVIDLLRDSISVGITTKTDVHQVC